MIYQRVPYLGQEGLIQHCPANHSSPADVSGEPKMTYTHYGAPIQYGDSPWGGSYYRFDGINDRCLISVADNPDIEFARGDHLAFFCRFRVVSYPSDSQARLIFGKYNTTTGLGVGCIIGQFGGYDIGFITIKDETGMSISEIAWMDGNTDWHTLAGGIDVEPNGVNNYRWWLWMDGSIIDSDYQPAPQGFAMRVPWSIGALPGGSGPANVDIAEFGIVKNFTVEGIAS